MVRYLALAFAILSSAAHADQDARAAEIEAQFWMLANGWPVGEVEADTPLADDVIAERMIIDGCLGRNEALRSEDGEWAAFVRMSFDLTRIAFSEPGEDRFQQIGPDEDPWGIAFLELNYPDGRSLWQWDDRHTPGVLMPTGRYSFSTITFSSLENAQVFEDFLILLHSYQADFCRLTG